ncbi:MBL fold metallo-hydrolase [Candidatus Nomurabacteria bacterium]|nr:MBL fold metallo-hydrolase [Candidatus Nomurabacteria bacterium]
MQITTYGHCCLLIELAGKRVLTDPGTFSSGFEDLTDIDLILITHEHADHLHTEALQALIEQNPGVHVVTNGSVGKILAELEIPFAVLAHEQKEQVAGIHLKAYDGPHEEIFEEFGLVQNTGFLLEHGEFFYPGDSYIVPIESVNVLAAPVAGPWCKVANAIRYVLKVAPKTMIPVHDAGLSKAGKAVVYPHFERELMKQNITFTALKSGETVEL